MLLTRAHVGRLLAAVPVCGLLAGQLLCAALQMSAARSEFTLPRLGKMDCASLGGYSGLELIAKHEGIVP